MPSLNTILLLVAVLVMAYLLSRLLRPRRAQTSAASMPADKPPFARSAAADAAQNYATDTKQTIEIDADRSIEPDLAAALDQADAEIRQVEVHSMQASGRPDPITDETETAASELLLQTEVDQRPAGAQSAYAPDVSISDAELIEPAGEPVATVAVASDNRSDRLAAQIESNSAQLMLVDSFTDLLIGTDTLSQSLQRVVTQSAQNQRARSKINAGQQRKLILANNRISTQSKDIDAAKSAQRQTQDQLASGQREIEHLRTQMAEANQTLALRESAFEKQQQQLAKSRLMARSAAKLARRAAVTQQQAVEMAENEKKRRNKVESRTQQAISIAKDAITALAEQEKKNKINSAVN